MATPQGVMPASRIHPGQPTVCMVGGLPKFVLVKSVKHIRSATLVWVYGDLGDVHLGPETAVVTSSGLITAEELAYRRDGRSIGRMRGDWPKTEKPIWNLKHLATSDVPVPGEESFIRATIVSQEAPFENPTILRIGAHPQQVSRRFEAYLGGGDWNVVVGPCGWSWLTRGRKNKKERINEVVSAHDILCLWKPGAAPESYLLPIEAEETRLSTFALLSASGFFFTVDYRPRYFPIEVQIELGDAISHASIQGVLHRDGKPVVELTLAEAGYLVVGGFLCSQ